MKCVSKSDGRPYAVKLITGMFDNVVHLKQLVREIHIMRMLSSMPNNIFTTKLYDVIFRQSDDKETNSL